jgi:hypothetical protein
MLHDVFICHASEDKDDFVRPLAETLKTHHLDVWYDEFTLIVGDSLREAIDRGLANSRFGIVVLSPHFFLKRWPQRELNGLVAREIAEGRRVVLPVWHCIDRDAISPLCHLHVFWLPEREGINGRRGPRPARLAVAIPNRLRLPGHLYFDGAAKASAGIVFAHENSPPSRRLPDRARGADARRKPGPCGSRASRRSYERRTVLPSISYRDPALSNFRII